MSFILWKEGSARANKKKGRRQDFICIQTLGLKKDAADWRPPMQGQLKQSTHIHLHDSQDVKNSDSAHSFWF